MGYSTKNNYVHPKSSGYKHIPEGGREGQILRYCDDGIAQWGEDNDTVYSNATESEDGLMSSTDKSKLNGIENGAQVNLSPNDLILTFTEALSRDNIVSDEKLPILFGKIKKWFADLKPIAFSGNYNDLTDKPATVTVDAGLSATSVNPVQNKAVYSALGGKAALSHTHNIPHTATYVVGSSVSGYTENDVDYLCDGVDDHEQIQAAIEALPEGGGRIVLLEGTYNLNAQITITKSNLTLEGMGESTVLSNSAQIHTIRGDNLSHVHIKRMRLVNSPTAGASTVMLKYTTDSTVEDCVIEGGTGDCLAFEESCSYITAVNNCLINGTRVGLMCYRSTHHIAVINNKIEACGDGIRLWYGTEHCILRGNKISGCTKAVYVCSADYNSISNNYCESNDVGIYTQGVYNKLSDNILPENNTGIHVYDNKSQITGNLCYKSSYSSGQYSIYIGSGCTYSLIADNYIYGKNYTNANTGSTNTFVNNKYS